ncbi:MAG TPA: phosphoribosyltransferase family protein [Acidimicrobiales bacterium]|nr:ComF family protein [Acidimicrobiales bacterium]HMS89917.1 phosphoribosyltransferase family protein [Acidimicrobiales bacterium]HRA33705.1 phosphoribosyltransferase family protein [Acidimicrobiales bacterium]
MLLATSCPCCGRPGPAPCQGCTAELRPSAPVPVPPGLDGCRALLDYDGAARDLVARVKYRNQRAVLGWLAVAMAPLVGPGSVQVVTWAPTTAARRRARGFDHAELLARKVARAAGLPWAGLLERIDGPAQTGRSRMERRHAPVFAPRRPLPGAAVLVVDDVITTGATVAAAAAALRLGGAERVLALAAAHTR